MGKKSKKNLDFKEIKIVIKSARTERKGSRKQEGNEIYSFSRYLINIEIKGQHPRLQIFIELVRRYHISVDQYIFDSPPEKNTQRQQLDALLDNMSDNGIRVIYAAAKEIAGIEHKSE